jgi:pimeloyl-ACP methyl ester carboxylesterase
MFSIERSHKDIKIYFEVVLPPTSLTGLNSFTTTIHTAQMSIFTTIRAPRVPPDPNKLVLQPNEYHTLTLPDARVLGYATYGSTNPSSPVIFLFHGLPGSRICGRGWDKLCTRLDARLITIDRPGYGLSTPATKRLTDWPEDVVHLADHLSVPQFSIIGASAGGPFALACARFIPSTRLRRTTIVCGIGSLESVLDTTPYLSWRLGGLTYWTLSIVARYFVLPSLMRPYLTKDPAVLKRVLEDQCSTPEEKAAIYDTTRPTNLDDAVVQFLEAFRQGREGCTHDGYLLTSPWGFDLKDVDGQMVSLVHGDQDAIAPLANARWMDERLGGGRLKVLEGKTHFTIWKEGEEEIFKESIEV